MDRIEWLRIIHVGSAVLLVGNVTVSGFWAGFLYRQRGLVPFRQVVRAILWADLFFLLGAAIGLTASGVMLAIARGLPVLDTPWLYRGIVILVTTILVWLFWLLPDQRRMERLIMGDESRLRRLFLRWSVVRCLATAAMFWALWGMVTRQ